MRPRDRRLLTTLGLLGLQRVGGEGRRRLAGRRRDLHRVLGVEPRVGDGPDDRLLARGVDEHVRRPHVRLRVHARDERARDGRRRDPDRPPGAEEDVVLLLARQLDGDSAGGDREDGRAVHLGHLDDDHRRLVEDLGRRADREALLHPRDDRLEALARLRHLRRTLLRADLAAEAVAVLDALARRELDHLRVLLGGRPHAARAETLLQGLLLAHDDDLVAVDGERPLRGDLLLVVRDHAALRDQRHAPIAVVAEPLGRLARLGVDDRLGDPPLHVGGRRDDRGRDVGAQGDRGHVQYS